jgi:hypothetical protein
MVTRYRLDSQFNCSYLESSGDSGKNAGNTGKKRGKLSPFHFRFPVHDFRWHHFLSPPVTSGDVISGDATYGYVISGDVTAPPQMISGWCIYTTINYLYLKGLLYIWEEMMMASLHMAGLENSECIGKIQRKLEVAVSVSMS